MRRPAAVVVVQGVALQAGIDLVQLDDALHRGPPPGVDALVLVAHAEQAVLGGGQQPHQQGLGRLDVLVLVHQHPPEAGLPAPARLSVRLQKAHGAGDEIIEVQLIPPGQLGLVGRVQGVARLGRRLQTGQLEVADEIAGVAHAGGRVAVPLDELQQAVVVQLAQAAAQPALVLQYLAPHAVKAAHHHAAQTGRLQALAYFHLGVAVEGHAQDVCGRGAPLLQLAHPADEHGGLAAAGRGDDLHHPVARLDGGQLLRIQPLVGGMGVHTPPQAAPPLSPAGDTFRHLHPRGLAALLQQKQQTLQGPGMAPAGFGVRGQRLQFVLPAPGLEAQMASPPEGRFHQVAVHQGQVAHRVAAHFQHRHPGVPPPQVQQPGRRVTQGSAPGAGPAAFVDHSLQPGEGHHVKTIPAQLSRAALPGGPLQLPVRQVMAPAGQGSGRGRRRRAERPLSGKGFRYTMGPSSSSNPGASMRPQFLPVTALAVVLVVTALLVWGELADSRGRVDEAVRLMEAQGNAIAEIVGESSLHGLTVFSLLEREQQTHLVDNANWLAWVDGQRALSESDLDKFAADLGLWRIMIYDRAGALERSSLPAGGQRRQGGQLPESFLTPLVKGGERSASWGARRPRWTARRAWWPGWRGPGAARWWSAAARPRWRRPAPSCRPGI